MKNSQPSEYYIGHFKGPYKATPPSGPNYWKMIEDLKKLQNAIAEWQPAQNAQDGDVVCRSEVCAQLGMIQSGVEHWQQMAEVIEESEAQEEWQQRHDEWEAVQLNYERAGTSLLLAKSILVANQDALWAVLFLLLVNREKSAVHLLEECSDSVTPIPPVLSKCFAQLGLSDDTSIRKAMKPA